MRGRRTPRAPTYALLLALVTAGLAGGQVPGASLVVRASDGSTGAPLPDVIVSILGTSFRAHTDSLGRAHIVDVPEGVHRLVVRRLGYEPRTTVLPLFAERQVELAISLTPVPAYLPPVQVIAALYSAPWLREFEQRRLRGGGRFITEREIRAAHGSDLGLLLMAKVPGVRITGRGPGRYVYSLRGPSSITGGCQAAVYLDGVRVPDGDAGEVTLNQLGGIEFHRPGTIPPRYSEPGLKLDGDMPRGGSAACGVLLLWTRP